MSQPEIADRFHSLFLQQQELMGELLQLARGQLQAIREEQMEDLLGLLGEKQPLLDQLTTIRTELKSLGDQLNGQPMWLQDPRREICQQLREEASQQFEVLIRVEAECEKMLEKNKEEIRQRLEIVDSGQSAAIAYQRPAEPRSSGLDFSS